MASHFAVCAFWLSIRSNIKGLPDRNDGMNIQLYPGHMTKAKRAMESDIKLVDLIIELVDARLPYSSRNPDIDRLGKQKARLIILNKSDLADEAANRSWEKYFQEQGCVVVRCNARSGSGVKNIQNAIREACKEKLERDRRKGIQNRPIRAMVVGIPNVGKSTLINALAKKSAAKTGNKPGVTKGNQWIRLNQMVELLDTPGILWPKLEEESVGIHLALVGSINDNILNLTELAGTGISFLRSNYPGAIAERYGVCEDGEVYKILAEMATARNCLKKGGEGDMDKMATLFLDDFRSGRLGKISLEWPRE